ncbi:hypothetical protein [Bradyrhizobium sp. WSM1743]|uniref:hypothetical protein n=1 Tax=Bradyrhizobium sp. WSM1743 TaxID=318996 RepID=UPI0012EB9E34|nr:hypothetical protein [Bradyrhizobium sp. WSM1743]
MDIKTGGSWVRDGIARYVDEHHSKDVILIDEQAMVIEDADARSRHHPVAALRDVAHTNTRPRATAIRNVTADISTTACSLSVPLNRAHLADLANDSEQWTRCAFVPSERECHPALLHGTNRPRRGKDLFDRVQVRRVFSQEEKGFGNPNSIQTRSIPL